MHSVSRSTLVALIILGLSQGSGFCQEKSVRPGINDPFKNPDIKHFTDVFETESREIFAKRKQIVAACKIKSGMVVADVGAGTGLFTLLFSAEVGDKGKVYAVEIAPKFIEHIEKICKEKGIKKVLEEPKLLKENYCLVFERVAAAKDSDKKDR